MNFKNNKGETPIFAAFQKGDFEQYIFSEKYDNLKQLVELLVKSGADINLKNNDGQALIHIETLQGNQNF